MVVLNIKRGEEPCFLLETSTAEAMDAVVTLVSTIYHARLQVERLCQAMEGLAAHGIMKTPQMQGLTDDQIRELNYHDDREKFYPSGGAVVNEDQVGLRTGQAPQEKLQEVMKKTIAEARAAVHKNLTKQNIKMTLEAVQENLDRLRGAVMIVYPMGLPPYDEVQACLDDKEDLSGRQAGKEVIPEADVQLWWAGKELQRGKALHQFIGKNEKTKIVVKIQKRGAGAPVREPVVDEETQKQMMAYAHKKQEEWKTLEASEEDSYLNSGWADTTQLKNSLQGTAGVKWR